jgi:hypothetical protein
MRSNSKKKGNFPVDAGGPVRKIQVPAFEFDKASLKNNEEKIPNLLKGEDLKKQSRLGSGRNTLLKPLEQEEKLKGNTILGDKQKFYDSNVKCSLIQAQWISDLSKK